MKARGNRLGSIHLQAPSGKAVFRVLRRYAQGIPAENAPEPRIGSVHQSRLIRQQAAQLSGFADTAYFVRVFRETYGITPAKAKRLIRGLDAQINDPHEI
jgi:transcriptional regulator GlxA family with amidase domain